VSHWPVVASIRSSTSRFGNWRVGRGIWAWSRALCLAARARDLTGHGRYPCPVGFQRTPDRCTITGTVRPSTHTLVVLYFLLQNGISCPNHQDSFLHFHFPRTHLYITKSQPKEGTS
jgi:hypothetical protein